MGNIIQFFVLSCCRRILACFSGLIRSIRRNIISYFIFSSCRRIMACLQGIANSFSKKTKNDDNNNNSNIIESQNEFEDNSKVPGNFSSALILGGVGDALGFYQGIWEFCRSGTTIQEQVSDMGGIDNIIVKLPKFPLSDDTIMQIASAKALLDDWQSEHELFVYIAKRYVECMRDMGGRSPGGCTLQSTHKLSLQLNSGIKVPYVIPYSRSAGGCGAAMRAVPFGLFYCLESELEQLIKVSLEAGRTTHHQSTGFLGSVATAVLVSLAIRKDQPPSKWGSYLLCTCIPIALNYCRTNDQDHRSFDSIDKDWSYFSGQWKAYLQHRHIDSDGGEPTFPSGYNSRMHDEFVKKFSFSGWGGSSGHDAPMIAYDAFLFALSKLKETTKPSNEAWVALCNNGMFHGGDSDSTGIIAGALWGAYYGFEGVPNNNYDHLEYLKELNDLGKKLYQKSQFSRVK